MPPPLLLPPVSRQGAAAWPGRRVWPFAMHSSVCCCMRRNCFLRTTSTSTSDRDRVRRCALVCRKLRFLRTSSTERASASAPSRHLVNPGNRRTERTGGEGRGGPSRRRQRAAVVLCCDSCDLRATYRTTDRDRGSERERRTHHFSPPPLPLPSGQFLLLGLGRGETERHSGIDRSTR